MQPNNVITINKTVLTNKCTRGLQTILTAKLSIDLKIALTNQYFMAFITWKTTLGKELQALL